MYHAIQFTAQCLADVETGRRQPLERVLIPAGTQLRAQLKPYVVETQYGPVEVADLFLEDDTTVRAIPFACFAFEE